MLAHLCKRLQRTKISKQSLSSLNIDLTHQKDKPNDLLQKSPYFTGPIVLTLGAGISALGMYWRLRIHFNPIKARSFDEVMKSNMIGQAINGNIDVQLPSLDLNLQNEINETRNDTIKKIRMRFDFRFSSGNLYLRPIYANNNIDIDTHKLMNDYGICHMFWILNAGPVDYILDFVQEGIRFEMIENANGVINNYPNEYIPCFKSPISLNVGSYNIIKWIEDEAKLNSKYDLNNNHCLHFVDRFGQHYKPEIFNDTKTFSKFNVGVKQKTNQELLEWTKSVINANTTA